MNNRRGPSLPKLCLVLFLGMCGTLIFFSGASAQQVEISSTLNPVGSGARATGMGGAFIGVADDATAASWNPGGLIQLEKPEVSLVYANFYRDQQYHPTQHPKMNADNSIDTSAINYASVAYPFVLLNRNMIISLNYQRLYEMDKKVSTPYNFSTAPLIGTAYNFVQRGDLHAVSPAFAVQIKPGLSAGVTLNLWNDWLGNNGWESTTYLIGTSFPIHYLQEDQNSFSGVNANFGVLWSFSGPFTLGLVYKTPFNAGLKKKEAVFQDFTTSNPPVVTVRDDTMVMPASYGAGLQYRRSDQWTLAMDIYRTQWSRFYVKDAVDGEVNPLDGLPLSSGRLKDTTQVRLGTEYLFIGKDSSIALRGGLFYDPEPGKDRLNNFYGFSLGTGYSVSRFALDASYQYRLGKNVDGDIASVQGHSVDITQQTVMVSGILYF